MTPPNDTCTNESRIHPTIVCGTAVPAYVQAELDRFCAHCLRDLPDDPTQQGLYKPALQSYPFPVAIFRVYAGTMAFVLTQSGGIVLLDHGLPVRRWGPMALLAPDPFSLALSSTGYPVPSLQAQNQVFSAVFGSGTSDPFFHHPLVLNHIRTHLPPSLLFINDQASLRLPNAIPQSTQAHTLVEQAFSQFDRHMHAKYPPIGSDYGACYERNWTDAQQCTIHQDLLDLMICLGQNGSLTLNSAFDDHPASWSSSNYTDPNQSFVASPSFVEMLHTYIGYGPHDLRAYTFGFSGGNINHRDSYTRTPALVAYVRFSSPSAHQQLTSAQKVYAKLHALGIEPGYFLEKATQALHNPSSPLTPNPAHTHQQGYWQRLLTRIKNSNLLRQKTR